MDRKISFRHIAICLAFILLPTGCATDKSGSSVDTRTALVVIDLSKTPKAADCTITVTIENHTGTAWDGASYNLALHDRHGASAERLMGAPRSKVKPGGTLTDHSRVTDTPCENIASATLVYFGYYPAGEKQVAMHNTNVRVRFD